MQSVRNPERREGTMGQRWVATCFASFLVLGLGGAAARGAGGPNVLGIGADNIAMAGAGVALADDPQGALATNPALLVHLDGNRFAISTELSQQDSAVTSKVGPFSGRTESDREEALPAFAWTRHDKGSRAAFGVGFSMQPGFGVDYPQDPTNPILAPQPNGFGKTSSSYRIGVANFVAAWQVSDDFSLGFALNAARAELMADPAGFATPDCAGASGPCFFPRVDSDSEWGYGATVGAHYQIVPSFALGFSYTSATNFQDFEWNSVVANPSLPTFGRSRQVALALDAPAVAILGLAWMPGDRFAIALDAKRIGYENADGYGDTLGFQDVTVIAAGIEWRATDRFSVRGGYSHGDNPIPEDRAFSTVATPVLVEDFAALGFGIRIDDSLELGLAYARGFENEISGPFVGVAGPVSGTTVTNEASVDSAVASLSWKF
jgi:long-chain fatty acid transport protein